jgi:hypothetical protein
MARDLALRQLLEEALSHVLGDSRNSKFGVQYVKQRPLAQDAKIEKEMGSEMAGEQLEKRLRGFKYPYPHGTQKKGTTFYDHLKKLGLLKLLFDIVFLVQIYFARFEISYRHLQYDHHKKQLSHHGYKMAVHRELMNELVRHLKRISYILHDNRVPDEWLSEYRKSALKELWRQAEAYYRGTSTFFTVVPSRMRPRAHTVDIDGRTG